MQASIENLEGLKRLITVTVPAEDVKKAYANCLRKTAKNARIDGFRKGHVPTKVLENYYGSNMLGETYDVLVRETLPKAVEESQAKIVGTPEVSFEKSSFDKDGEFVYTASFEVEPEIEDKPLSEMTLKVTNSVVTDADIDKMIETLRKQQAKWKVKEDAAAEMGNLVKIDFVGRVDGQEFAGGKAQDFSLHLGTTQMIPGLAEGIIGHKAGETFIVNVTFPEDYPAENLKGKPAEFDITVNSVSEQILPEIDQDFFKLYGVEDGTMESFRNELRTNMEREQKRALIAVQRSNVITALLDYFGDFAVPAAAVEACRKQLKERDIAQMRSYGLPSEHIEKMYEDPEHRKEQAVEDARAQFLLARYVDKSGLKAPSEESIEFILNMYAKAYEEPEAVKREMRKDKKRFSAVREQAFERDVLNYIQSNAKCEPEEKTFSELMGLD